MSVVCRSKIPVMLMYRKHCIIENNNMLNDDDADLPPIEELAMNENGEIDDVRQVQLHVITYLASHIEKEMIESKERRLAIKCLRACGENESVCGEFLERKAETEDIMIPCSSTVIIQKSEYYIKEYNKTIDNILAAIDFKNGFTETDFDHQDQDHKKIFITTIAIIYLRKKMNFITRMKTRENVGVLLRSQLKKTIHFKGQ